jgi:hypothetical protein
VPKKKVITPNNMEKIAAEETHLSANKIGTLQITPLIIATKATGKNMRFGLNKTTILKISYTASNTVFTVIILSPSLLLLISMGY